MAGNQLLNAVVAFLENKPERARNMLRGPGMGMSVTPSEVHTRVVIALEKANAQAVVDGIRQVMFQSMALSGSEEFLQGVVAVEELLEKVLMRNLLVVGRPPAPGKEPLPSDTEEEA